MADSSVSSEVFDEIILIPDYISGFVKTLRIDFLWWLSSLHIPHLLSIFHPECVESILVSLNSIAVLSSR